MTYEIKEQPKAVSKDNALAIDLGVENLATCVTTEGQSFIIDGRYLKSIIQGFEKYMSKIRSIKHSQGLTGLYQA